MLTGVPGLLDPPEHALEALDAGGGDLEDVAVLARHVMALEHLGIVHQRRDRGLLAEPAGHRVADGDEGGDGEAGLGPVEPRVVALDDTRLFHALDPLHHGRPGEPDRVGDGLVAGPAVIGEEPEDVA